MSDFASIPLSVEIIIAVLSLCAMSYTGVIATAVNRVTRSEAAEAAAHDAGGKYIANIVNERASAITATHGARVVFAAIFAISTAAALNHFVQNFWLLLVLSLAVIAGGSAIVSFVFPGSFGRKHPLGVIRSVNYVLWVFTKLTALFAGRRDTADDDERETEHEDQLALMVERVSESEAIEDDERSLLHSVFELSRTRVREVMVPRTDMISIGGDESVDRAFSLFARSGFSRVPVIGDSVDDLRGVLYLKDAIRRVHHRVNPKEITVADVMRKPVFVPETKMVDALLHEMQANTVHIALVVDEYGGIAGLVTIEDLLEELVGEMVDEHDVAHPEVEALDDGTFRVPARLPIDDLGELFGLSIEDDDVDTAGGLLAKALGRVPITGSHTVVQGLELAADRFEGRRKRLATIIASLAPEENIDE
ncbi:hemolysin family protein [Arcanobacterium bovis]|uniref:HlyC/CorC family transporter n=1 Tax=Arcanobacterium bovis TaxID=2529275 RepID=A0A4Q9V063_9ACTO|nr:hemolysin family protein [Arcanobacterium bovis]TBW22004.1 HlyC/CorC family transporter [Arcanobacterium bovis]